MSWISVLAGKSLYAPERRRKWLPRFRRPRFWVQEGLAETPISRRIEGAARGRGTPGCTRGPGGNGDACRGIELPHSLDSRMGGR